MMNLKRRLLPLAALLVLMPAPSMAAGPAQAAVTPPASPPPVMAPAPKAEPYGWWHSKTPDPFSRPSMNHAATGGPVPSVRPRTESKTGGAAANTLAVPTAPRPQGHSFALNRSPVQSLYLKVAGADPPEEAPEVYYRFTARTMERHGGVALGSSWHRAEVVRDEDTWRADFTGSSFGTVEVYSRFKLDGRYVYSQHNYLHFIRDEDAKGVKMPERIEGPPADWPQFVFPVSSYNDMPFRGAQVGRTVDFSLRLPEGRTVPTEGFLLEENMPEPLKLDYSSMSQKFSLTPQEDSRLLEGGDSYRGAVKKALALIELPGSRDIMTFTMNVSRSRWSTRKLGFGLLAAVAVAGITAAIVVRRRRRFKYNDLD